MKDSIVTFIRENRNVRDWMENKRLANMLKHAGKDVQSRISSEAANVQSIDRDLSPYGSDLLQLQNDLTVVKQLRAEESRLREEISVAQENLAKEVKKKKNLITLAIAAIVAIIVGVGILITVLPSVVTEPEIVETVE